MGRYQAFTLDVDGLETVQLYDAETQSEAAIATSIGNNLYRYTVGNDPIILTPPELSLLEREPFAPFQYGTPILYPPNRVKNACFSYKGKTYHLPQNEPPNHLHGELCLRAWKIVQTGASNDDGAYVTSEIQIADHPDIYAYFPHRLRVTITHRLKDGRLSMNGSIQNEGSDEAPFAFGLHPYFSIPFDREEQIELTVPSVKEWPVTNEAFVMGEPSETKLSGELPDGVNIADYPVLGCSLLSLAVGDSHCKIALKNKGITIHYAFDETYPYVVLFRPDWAQSFSLEPYTSVTDAFNLPYAAKATGAKGIQSGESITFQTQIWIERSE